jgi:hypothetical protein
MKKRYDYGDVYYTKAEVDAKVSALTTGLGDNVVVDLAQGASLDLLQAMVLEEMKLVVVPRVATLTVAEATAGTSVVCDITAKAGNLTILPANWDITVSISDTITDVETTPALDDNTVSLVNGATTVTVTVPAGTYVADEKITVAVADYTLPSGVKVTDTVGEITIVATDE